MTYSRDNLTIGVSGHGAELTSLRRNGREYLWNGDATYWNRHSPVLFPVVGKPYNNEIRVDGKVYPMKQHGFARDSEFEQVDAGHEGISFRMKDTDHRKDVYPYRFGLEVAYFIKGDTLTVSWYVKNLDDRMMYYQIGAHPAFLLPDYNPDDEVHGYIRYYDNTHGTYCSVSPVIVSALNDGNRVPLPEPKQLPHNMPITSDTFTHDALMIENVREQKVSTATLCDKQGRPVLSVDCHDADAYGIWAPNKPGCPFVCLEPWQGICDRKGFAGDISERDIIRSIAPGDHGRFGYSITIGE